MEAFLVFYNLNHVAIYEAWLRAIIPCTKADQ